MTRRFSSTDLALLKTDLGAALPPPKKRRYEEAEMERALHRWWNSTHKAFGVPSQLLFKVTNEGARGIVGGRLAKLAGMKKGAPDQILAWPRWNKDVLGSGCWEHGLFLELKRKDGVVSDEQTEFHSALTNAGYRTAVCRSLNECINAITSYLHNQ